MHFLWRSRARSSGSDQDPDTDSVQAERADVLSEHFPEVTPCSTGCHLRKEPQISQARDVLAVLQEQLVFASYRWHYANKHYANTSIVAAALDILFATRYLLTLLVHSGRYSDKLTDQEYSRNNYSRFRDHLKSGWMGIRRAAVLMKTDDFRDIADLALMADNPDFSLHQEIVIRKWVSGKRPGGWSLSWLSRPSIGTLLEARKEIGWTRECMRKLELLKRATGYARMERCLQCKNMLFRIVSVDINLMTEWFMDPTHGPGNAVREMIAASSGDHRLYKRADTPMVPCISYSYRRDPEPIDDDELDDSEWTYFYMFRNPRLRSLLMG